MFVKRHPSLTINSIQDALSSISISAVRDLFLIAAAASVLFSVANNTISKSRTEKDENIQNYAAGANIIRSADYKDFKWNSYASPENPIFFDEGEGHIPPRPYIYLAQHPTLENAIKLQEWQRKKMEVTNQISQLLLEASKPMDLQKLISLSPEGLGTYLNKKNEAQASTLNLDKSIQQKQTFIPTEVNNETSDPFKVTASDFKNVSILYFYRSDCPHCRNTKPTIDKLQSLGVTVIPVQLDYKIHAPEFKNSMPYDSQIASVYPVTETPNFVLKINGETRSFKGEITPAQLVKVVSLIKGKKG